MTGPLRRQTVQEAVLDELRRSINDGDLQPGALIRPDTVAETLQVSRIPIREALKILEGEGLVTHRPHAGYLVRSLTPQELEEIYWLRGLLEGEALVRSLPRATEEDRAAAREACCAAGDALTRGDVNAYSAQARRFHAAVLAAAGQPRLLRLLEGLWDATEAYRPARFVASDECAHLQEEHAEILTAFLDGDARDLRDAWDRHREHLLLATRRGAAPVG